jgi:hypothetical protein
MCGTVESCALRCKNGASRLPECLLQRRALSRGAQHRRAVQCSASMDDDMLIASLRSRVARTYPPAAPDEIAADHYELAVPILEVGCGEWHWVDTRSGRILVDDESGLMRFRWTSPPTAFGLDPLIGTMLRAVTGVLLRCAVHGQACSIRQT